MNSNQSILFFSRGRGYGHAIPDLDIARELCALRPDICISFVSYATGATVFRSAGVLFIDLLLREDAPFIEVLLACEKIIKLHKPAIILAHEEFSALVGAVIHGIPSILISAWFPRNGTPAAEAVRYASSIIVIENPGIFEVPSGTRAPVHYVGPIIRTLSATAADRQRVRKEMEIADDSFVILVVPGGASSEERFPIAPIVFSAFSLFKRSVKSLIWLSNKDFDLLSASVNLSKDMRLLRYFEPIDHLLISADVIITKGTRGITLDALSIGVPTISLSPGQNPIDDILVPRMPSNIALNARAVDGAVLVHYIDQVAKRGRMRRGSFWSNATVATAARLSQEIDRILSHDPKQ